MNWDQVQVTWKRLIGKFVVELFRVSEDTRKGLEPTSATISTHDKIDAQPPVFRPDDREKRSEFSLHIGC